MNFVKLTDEKDNAVWVNLHHITVMSRTEFGEKSHFGLTLYFINGECVTVQECFSDIKKLAQSNPGGI